MTQVELFEDFKRDFKRLAKKFRTLTEELEELIAELETNPGKGTDLGSGLHKIRLRSKSKGGGKSGGFRVITYYIEKKTDIEIVYLISIYDKSEFSTIEKNELMKIIKDALE
ncbi:type II toxin-antitoxin system RelE/ParE family toxin [Runella sp.]|uniref:type II toxin-antitoxin system RelE/ParE family toxin n=1 Tax=Runella sp. TaxID=1960881 RepID=UPI003D0E5107